MIDSTFCFLSGVGPATEQRWWTTGISNWNQFLAQSDVPRVSRNRKARYDEDVALAEEQYQKGNARFFAGCLAARHQWRLYEWLRPKAVYLDIETDSFGRITLVGLYGNGIMTSLVRGECLTRRRLHEELAQYDLVVSFCGMGFDLPMLRAQFGPLQLDQPHLDLYPVARAAGFRGGLKAIEAAIGIMRREDLRGMNGGDAVCCWNRWRRVRDAHALEQLIAYNAADSANLVSLADFLYCRLARQLQKSVQAI